MDPFISATELAAQIRTRAISPVEVAEFYLDRIERHNPALNAIIWRNDEEVLEQARRVERALRDSEDRLPPFAGVPMPIKDVVSVAGQPNTFGSTAFSDAPQLENDLIVDRILAAGFIPMGRTNTPEAAMTQVTENTAYGITRNPWDLDRTPGGSSGGASAAVAGGLAPIASGGDGAGSIRMPASCTGLVGLKPSRARVPSKVLLWEHGAAGGALTRTVQDAAGVLDALSVADPLGWYRAPTPERPFVEELNRPVQPLRIGLLTQAPAGVPVDPACVAAAETTAQLLEEFGHNIVPLRPEIISSRAIEIYLYTVLGAGLHALPWSSADATEPYIAARMAMGEKRPSSDYIRDVFEMHLESRRMIAHWFDDFDVLLTPTLATRVPEVGTVLEDANRRLDGSSEFEARMLAFCAFVNITGLPAISLPVAVDTDGLPVGAQLVGGPFCEAVLLRLGSALEQVLEWQSRRPPHFV
ncbi:amidase [Acrocarpospora macrocephala]|uniref:6-aminohexanoate-cyclic-dimer hydrolase n=1 Tax=Acrocarpospora macrocephala TaxID=150177 RepID=A0A5M3WMS4_9ACTN|nr:amidase [Acrocarpospora macrocephala]GES08481.1 6-aminohexanoate-cyclic-dimer hydrolase [Acrocarpospora macrocephala]